jgi:hypothetical protein
MAHARIVLTILIAASVNFEDFSGQLKTGVGRRPAGARLHLKVH